MVFLPRKAVVSHLGNHPVFPHSNTLLWQNAFLTLRPLLLNFLIYQKVNLFSIHGVYRHDWEYPEKTLVRPPEEYIYSSGGFCAFSS